MIAGKDPPLPCLTTSLWIGVTAVGTPGSGAEGCVSHSFSNVIQSYHSLIAHVSDI